MNQQILDRIDALAAKLNVATSVIWTALQNQARVAAITDLIVLALCGVAAYWIYRWVKWIIESDSDGEWFVGVFLAGIPVVIFAAISIYSLPSELLNPNYYALQKLAELFK